MLAIAIGTAFSAIGQDTIKIDLKLTEFKKHRLQTFEANITEAKEAQKAASLPMVEKISLLKQLQDSLNQIHTAIQDYHRLIDSTYQLSRNSEAWQFDANQLIKQRDSLRSEAKDIQRSVDQHYAELNPLVAEANRTREATLALCNDFYEWLVPVDERKEVRPNQTTIVIVTNNVTKKRFQFEFE